MTLKKYMPALVSGFGAAVLTTIPLLKSFGCCLIIPAAAILALYFDQRINSFQFRIKPTHAIVFGLLTGLFAGVFTTGFETFLTLIFKTNDLVASLPQIEMMFQDMNLGDMFKESMELMRDMAADIRDDGFSLFYTMYIFISHIIVDPIFGLLGGLLGMAIFNSKYHKQNNTPE